MDRDAYAAGTTVVGNKLWIYGGQWTQAGASNTIQPAPPVPNTS